MNFPLTKSIFGGKIGQEFDRLTDAINSLRPISSPGETVQHTTRGVVRSVRLPRKASGGGGGGSEISFGQVLSVEPNSLTVELYSGEVVSVEKPPDLNVSGYHEYDAAIISAYSTGQGTPHDPAWLYWFTQDYLMRTTTYPDFRSVDGFAGGMQSRFRLIYAPARDVYLTTESMTGLPRETPLNQTPLLEVVWPPYIVSAVNLGGGWDSFNPSTICVALLENVGDGGTYIDLNIDARKWVSEAQVNGWETVLEDEAGIHRASGFSYPRF